MSTNKTYVGGERKKKYFFVGSLKRKETEGDKPYFLYIVNKLAGVLLLLIIIFYYLYRASLATLLLRKHEKKGFPPRGDPKLVSLK
jgi:hypothetical protein